MVKATIFSIFSGNLKVSSILDINVAVVSRQQHQAAAKKKKRKKKKTTKHRNGSKTLVKCSYVA